MTIIDSLTNDAMQMLRDDLPPCVMDTHMDEQNMHNLLFAISGPPDTSFWGGVYVLKISLPQDYPYSPPDFIMLTPNGRFTPGSRICTTFSSYHPETWTPAYNLTTLLVSFVSFFSDETASGVGSVYSDSAAKRKLAADSIAWACRHGYPSTLRIFGHLKKGLQTQASLDAAITARTGKPVASRAAAPTTPLPPHALPLPATTSNEDLKHVTPNPSTAGKKPACKLKSSAAAAVAGPSYHVAEGRTGEFRPQAANPILSERNGMGAKSVGVATVGGVKDIVEIESPREGVRVRGRMPRLAGKKRDDVIVLDEGDDEAGAPAKRARGGFAAAVDCFDLT
jgi:ubiquitin-conjugating enzyme E2 J2